MPLQSILSILSKAKASCPLIPGVELVFEVVRHTAEDARIILHFAFSITH